MKTPKAGSPTVKTAPPMIPTASTLNLNWEEELAKFDINRLHPSRSCQVFSMCESHEVLFTAIDKFYKASKKNKEKIFRCITYEDILESLKYFSKANCTTVADILYKRVAEEANAYLTKGELIPCPLMAILVKLEMINIITKDIFAAQKEVFIERSLEEERVNMKAVPVVGKAGKGKGKKGKGKGKDKSKSSKSAKSSKSGSKGKGKKKKGGDKGNVYDICNPNNVLKFKKTTNLIKLQLSPENTNEIKPKHLIFVIIGFYDVNLIKTLYELKIRITGVVEISKNCPKRPSSVILVETSKSELVQSFWDELEGFCECNSNCPNFLNKTFHMMIYLEKSAFDTSTVNDKYNCRDVFRDITSEITKYENVQRQHTNYIRHLKNFDFESKPRKISKSHFPMYHNLMAAFPPECSTLFSIMYAFAEDAISRIPNPYEDTESTSSLNYNISSKESLSIRNQLLTDGCGEWNRTIKSQTANLLKSIIHKESSIVENNIFDKKVNISISPTPFLVDENNQIEIKLNSYKPLYPNLMSIHLDKYVKCLPIMLWNRYPLSHSESKERSNNRADLHSIAETLDLEIDELQFIIHTILLNAISCENNTYIPIEESTDEVQKLFPKKPLPKVNIESIDILSYYKIEPIEKQSFDLLDPDIPKMQYSNCPNLYESKNVCAFKWHEPLIDLVMLQEIYKANQNYFCLDHIYCKYDDTILLRFHNNSDNFGISCKVWNSAIRTVVNIREFCEYIINEDSDWLINQENIYKETLERNLTNAINHRKMLKQEFYPDLNLTMFDFIQRGSLKAQILEGDKPPEKTEETGKGKKGKKGKKGSDKSKKSSGKSKKGSEKSKKSSEKSKKGKGKGKKDVKSKTPSQLLTLEKLSEPVVPPLPRKLTLRQSGDAEPFDFYSYDISNARFQLTGSTTIFHSQDGYKVTIDTSHFAKEPDNLSLNAYVGGNSLILHYNKSTLLNPFHFHFVLEDSTFINFFKPPKRIPPEEKLCEKICQNLKKEMKDEETVVPPKRQQIYFICEKQLSVIKCYNIPYVTKRNLILSEELLIPFLQQLHLRGISTKLEPSESLTSEELRKFQEALGSEDSFETGSSTESAVEGEGEEIKTKSETIISEVQEESEESFQYQDIFDRTKQFSDILLKRVRPEPTYKRLLKKIKKTVEAQMPIFKICSSPLHKRQYVKRIKSYVEMQIGSILKRFTYKPPICKSKINLEISKLLPIKPGDYNKPPIAYHTKTSLPSGLYIETITGTENSNYNIRQKYLDKGPQCQKIVNEYSRTFTRTGDVIIKSSNGNIEVLNVHGQIVKCEVPLINVDLAKSTTEIQRRPNLAPVNIKSLTKFQKHVHKSLNRMQKHLIDNHKSQHLISRRACLRFKKRVIRDHDQVYMVQDSLAPFKRFSLITVSGNKLKVVPNVLTEEEKYYISNSIDYRYEEMLSEREDGVQTKTNRESSLVTQFADGTRITTWLDVVPEMLYVMKMPTPPDESFAHKQQQTDAQRESSQLSASQRESFQINLGDTIDVPESSSANSLEHFSTNTFHTNSVSPSNLSSQRVPGFDDEEEEEKVEGWVSVFLNYKYEHPNYATVVFYGRDNSSEVTLPNNVTITSTILGEYVVNINDKVCTKISMEEILLEARLCNRCLQKSIVKINIKPLYHYNKKSPIVESQELLRTIDSFGKVFKVNYNGQCFRNIQYQDSRTNLQGCNMHFDFESQKLFVLKRCLVGCRLWDVNSYKLRIHEGNKSDDVDVKVYDEFTYGNPRVELKTYVRIPDHEKFLILYEEPFLMLSKNRVKTCELKEVAYATRQIINLLPVVRNFYFIFLKIVEIYNELNLHFLKNFDLDSQVYLNQMVDLGLSVHASKSKITHESISVEEEPPKEIITFEMKYEEWLAAYEKYKKEFQERYVPSYFVLHQSKPELPRLEMENTICECPGNDDLLQNECQIIQVCNVAAKTNKNNEEYLKSKNVPYSHKQYEMDRLGSTIKSNSIVRSSQEETKSHVTLEPQQQEEILKIKTMIGYMLLSHIRSEILKIAVGLPIAINVIASEKKVTIVTQRLTHLLSNFVTEYEVNMPKQDYVESSVKIALRNVSKVSFNAVEWVLICNNLNQKTTLSTVLNRKISRGSLSSEGPLCATMQACRDSMTYPESLYLSQNKVKHESGFDVYSCSYFNKKNNKFQFLQKPDQIDEDDKSEYSKSKSDSFKTMSYSDHDECKVVGNTISEVLAEYEKLPLEKLKYYAHEEIYLRTIEKCQKCEDLASQNLKFESISATEHTPSTMSVDSRNRSGSKSSLIKSSQQDLSSEIDDPIENLESIGSHTAVLEIDSMDKTDSMKVLFSVASLKHKDLDKLYSMPYTQRLPKEGLINIINANSLNDKKFIEELPNDIDIGILDSTQNEVTAKKKKPPKKVDGKILDKDVKILKDDKCSTLYTLAPNIIPFEGPWRKSRGDQTEDELNEKEAQTPRRPICPIPELN